MDFGGGGGGHCTLIKVGTCLWDLKSGPKTFKIVGVLTRSYTFFPIIPPKVFIHTNLNHTFNNEK